MENLLIFFYILISISLILIILLQQGKGSDIGSAFGALGVKEPTTYHYFIFFLGFISSSIIWCFICALAVEKIFRFTK